MKVKGTLKINVEDMFGYSYTDEDLKIAYTTLINTLMELKKEGEIKDFSFEKHEASINWDCKVNIKDWEKESFIYQENSNLSNMIMERFNNNYGKIY